MNFCINHPEVIFAAHQSGRPFIAIHPEHGVVISAADEEEFEAELNDKRPSVLRELYKTCTSLFVHPAKA